MSQHCTGKSLPSPGPGWDKGVSDLMDRCNQARVRNAREPEWEARFEVFNEDKTRIVQCAGATRLLAEDAANAKDAGSLPSEHRVVQPGSQRRLAHR